MIRNYNRRRIVYMINRIKEYFEYRRNKKIAKRELAKMAATTLPVIREISDKGTDIAKFIVKLTNETKNIKGERLVEMVLNEVSTALQTDNNRIIEILTYMASLSPQDIQKVLVHSAVETMPTDNKTE